MIDPLTASAAAVAALAGTGVAWRLHRRVRQVEAHAANLRQQLLAERHVASHDPLTGLPNRRAFFRLGQALLTAPGRRPLVAVVLDLDNFKQINDELGHAAGDEVLAATARRLAEYAGDHLVARLGGDEFAGLLTVSTDPDSLRRTAAELADRLGAPVTVAGQPIRVTVSVGVIAVPDATTLTEITLTEVLRHADAAMYRAKHRRRAAAWSGAGARAQVDSPTARAEATDLAAALSGAAQPDWSTAIMPAPSIHPQQRDPAAVAPAHSYRHADPVWVYRSDGWRAGVVEAASPQAVTVTYRPPNSRGTGVDTLTAAYLVPRDDADPLLDHQR